MYKVLKVFFLQQNLIIVYKQITPDGGLRAGVWCFQLKKHEFLQVCRVDCTIGRVAGLYQRES